MRSERPEWQQKIAKERIQVLFGLAKKELNRKPERSRRYVELARKIGTRYKVRLPKDLKAKFCKRCNTLMVLGKTMKTKKDAKTKSVIIKCAKCSYSYRKPSK